MTDADVRRAIYDLTIRNGSTPAVADVAAELDASESDVSAAFHRLADQRIIVLDGETIRMAAPFSGIPTSFVVRIGAISYYANCIWDALGISPMLQTDSTIETSCPDCSQPLHLDIQWSAAAPGGANADAIVHFSVPARHWWADIVFT